MKKNRSSANEGLSIDTKTLLTVLLLVTVYPVGLVLMFMWMKWRWWVKMLIAAPVTIGVLGIFAAIMLAVVNPGAQIRRAECVKQCQEAGDNIDCTSHCSVVPEDEGIPPVYPVVTRTQVR